MEKPARKPYTKPMVIFHEMPVDGQIGYPQGDTGHPGQAGDPGKNGSPSTGERKN